MKSKIIFVEKEGSGEGDRITNMLAFIREQNKSWEGVKRFTTKKKAVSRSGGD